MRVKVKICGMTRPQDVADAVSLGVDAIGVILHANSPRLISPQQASILRQSIPAFVSMVGVFVDADAEKINRLSAQIGLDLVQLHGEESNDFGAQLQIPFIKAIRAKSAEYVSQQVEAFPQARALLLDPYVAGQHGGTGKQLNVEFWPQNVSKKLVLAGGLSPSNIVAAIDMLSPFAVDLNSGVETEPGVKNASFIEQALTAIGR